MANTRWKPCQTWWSSSSSESTRYLSPSIHQPHQPHHHDHEDDAYHEVGEVITAQCLSPISVPPVALTWLVRIVIVRIVMINCFVGIVMINVWFVRIVMINDVIKVGNTSLCEVLDHTNHILSESSCHPLSTDPPITHPSPTKPTKPDLFHFMTL